MNMTGAMKINLNIRPQSVDTKQDKINVYTQLLIQVLNIWIIF